MTRALPLVFKPVKTERLLIREFKKDDWRAVQAYASDPEVVRFLPFGPNTPAQSRAFITRATKRPKGGHRVSYELAVVESSSGRLIGGCALRVKNEEFGEGEMGYIYGRHSWGKGYGTEAAKALLDFAFGELGLHRVSAQCDPVNRGSSRVMEKCGMSYEGKMRENLVVRGRRRDSLLYSILRPEWASLREPERRSS